MSKVVSKFNHVNAKVKALYPNHTAILVDGPEKGQRQGYFSYPDIIRIPVWNRIAGGQDTHFYKKTKTETIKENAKYRRKMRVATFEYRGTETTHWFDFGEHELRYLCQSKDIAK